MIKLRILLKLSKGKTVKEVSEELNVSQISVRLVLRRYFNILKWLRRTRHTENGRQVYRYYLTDKGGDCINEIKNLTDE